MEPGGFENSNSLRERTLLSSTTSTIRLFNTNYKTQIIKFEKLS